MPVETAHTRLATRFKMPARSLLSMSQHVEIPQHIFPPSRATAPAVGVRAVMPY